LTALSELYHGIPATGSQPSGKGSSAVDGQPNGWLHRREFKEHYEANINIPVRYSDPDSIDNIRQVLGYMTKIQQKEGLPLFGCNEVPERPATGRPRKTDF